MFVVFFTFKDPEKNYFIVGKQKKSCSHEVRK